MVKTYFSKIIANLDRNLKSIEDDINLYRIMTTKKFFEMLDSKCMIFKKPEMWDDPYENFISKEQFQLKNNIGNQHFQYDLSIAYANCWTLNKECDGMWRAFASLECGVKITTTSTKLREVMVENRNNIVENVFIGEVLYLQKNQIDEFLENTSLHTWLTSGEYDPIAQIFLIKREEFSYEKEVRAIIINFDDSSEQVLKVHIDPKEFITQIEFSPKMTDECYSYYKNKLVYQYSFDEKIIFRSNLYDSWN